MAKIRPVPMRQQFAGLFGGDTVGDVRSIMEGERQARIRQAGVDAKAGGFLPSLVARARQRGIESLRGGIRSGFDLAGAGDMITEDPRLAKARKRETDKNEIIAELNKFVADDGIISPQEMQQGYALLMQRGYPEEARKFLEDAKKMADMDRLRAAADKDRRGPSAGRPQKGRVWMLENGEQLKGVTVFQGGKEYIQNADGSISPIPDGAKEITPGMLKNSMLSQDKFLQIKRDLIKDIQSIKRISGYAKEIQQGGKGLKLLVNQFIGSFKTAAGKSLTPEQIAAKIQGGDLNALIGQFRKEVVGGGVMTDQDALRVIKALGGDVSAWRSPEVVGRQLKKLFQDKLDFIKNNIEDYNNQTQFPGRGKLKKLKMPEFNLQVFDDLINNTPTTNTSSTVQSTTSSPTVNSNPFNFDPESLNILNRSRPN